MNSMFKDYQDISDVDDFEEEFAKLQEAWDPAPATRIGKKTAIKFEYFKDSGKYYTSGICTFTHSEIDEHFIHPGEYARYLNANNMLPGLANGSWDGPIYVYWGFPSLILDGIRSRKEG